jgi:hypothetical protein
MDDLTDLEDISEASFYESPSPDVVTTSDVATWQAQFGYTDYEVVEAIEAHRAYDVHFTAAEWEHERVQAEEQGHNQETWAHVRFCGGCGGHVDVQDLPQSYHARQVFPKFLVSLRGVLFDEDQVRKYTETRRALKSCDLCDEVGDTLDYVALHNFEWSFLQTKMPTCFLSQLLTLRVDPPLAYKQLLSHSISPMLGYEGTLPQYRFDSLDEIARPAQDEYPVVYFLYNDLANRNRLMRVLALAELPALEPAVALGGKLMTWGRYRALVNGEEDDKVGGVMYTVQNKVDEDFLRGHETGKYEVVRCIMYSQVDDMVVRGLTFRFRDEERHLLRELQPSPGHSGLW